MNIYDTPGDLGADIYIIQCAEAAGSRYALLQVPVFHGSRFHGDCLGRFLALVILVSAKAGPDQDHQKQKGIQIIFYKFQHADHTPVLFYSNAFIVFHMSLKTPIHLLPLHKNT